jgi:hypothetical protein
MRTAFSCGLYENGNCSWVIDAQWSTQMSDRRRWMVDADKWSTQMSDRRRWVVSADEKSAQMSGRRG